MENFIDFEMKKRSKMHMLIVGNWLRPYFLCGKWCERKMNVVMILAVSDYEKEVETGSIRRILVFCDGFMERQSVENVTENCVSVEHFGGKEGVWR